MDHMDSLPERSEVFEPQTEALARRACVVARRQRSWRGIAGCLLVLGLLSLALPVRTVEAQGGQRNIPVSLCTTSADIIRMSGGANSTGWRAYLPYHRGRAFVATKE